MWPEVRISPLKNKNNFIGTVFITKSYLVNRERKNQMKRTDWVTQFLPSLGVKYWRYLFTMLQPLWTCVSPSGWPCLFSPCPRVLNPFGPNDFTFSHYFLAWISSVLSPLFFIPLIFIVLSPFLLGNLRPVQSIHKHSLSWLWPQKLLTSALFTGNSMSTSSTSSQSSPCFFSHLKCLQTGN